MDYPTLAVELELSKLIQSDVFAEQICHLNEVKHNRMADKDNRSDAQAKFDADVSNPKYVMEWVIGAASNRNSQAAELPIISKKLRDDPENGFRRSGLWTTMKVLLQLGLTVASDSASQGKYTYKLIMLKFTSKMCGFLSEYSDANMNPNTFDTAVGMLAKIARRVDKLVNFPDVPKSIIDQSAEVTGEAIECISKIRRLLDTHHKKMMSRENIICKLTTLKGLKFDEHIVHEVSNLERYLAARKTVHPPKSEKVEENCEEGEPENFNPNTAPDVEKFKQLNTDNERLRFLNDIENWVLSCLDRSLSPGSTYFRSLATQYFAIAIQIYKQDPIGYSRMVLTMLKIIQVSSQFVQFHVLETNYDEIFLLKDT